MNNLAYSGQQAENIGSKIEEIVRKDMGSNEPLNFIIEEQGTPKDGVLNAILKDGASILFGGKETMLFTVNFDFQQPRPVHLTVNVNRQGVGCHAGSLVFSAFINKPLSAPVTMEGPKVFGTSKFLGDANATSKLNNNKDLLKLIEKFSRTKSDIAGGLKMERYVKLEPFSNGATLVIITLPRATSMGMSATTDAKDFFSIASMIEAAL
jgi:hypothetical protein